MPRRNPAEEGELAARRENAAARERERTKPPLPSPRPEPPDAAKAYDAKSREIDEKMRAIRECLRAHRREQREQPGNWGFVGDLGSAEERLSEILEIFEWGADR